jgi:hypothetical protein
MYKLSEFTLFFFYFTICFGHLDHHHVNNFFTFTPNFYLLFSPYIGQCLQFGGKVIYDVYSIDASSYANLKYMVKSILSKLG